MLHDRIDIGFMFSFRNPAQWRRPFADVYADELALIRHAEQIGVDTIWLTEHHFADDGYSPSIVPLAAAIAATTDRVRIGFNLLLLPLHDAVKVAEDIATVDVLSNGRLDPGFGQGYAPHEFAGFGIPREQRLVRFIEGLKVMQGLWSEDAFSFDGRHYHVDGARLVPKPVQQPMPLWIGATSRKGVRRAGRLGANLLGIASRALQDEYEQGRREAGLTMEDARALQLHWVHVAESDDAAWDQAAAQFHHLLTVYSGWANAAAGPGEPKAPPPPPVAELRDPTGPLMFVPAIGSAETVAAVLNRGMGRVHTTHLALGVLPGMAPDHTRASMDRFAAEVVPRLD
ncbi:MAG: LLM class flavin-dependent oxidoreductase [Acidimicrobiia bacterium]|nr:LLM class flavin-dependent oxidoreductase [Acidimicrobiia bacterium]